ncbi:MAG TPA: phospholipase D-like domain-containing protein [Gammaproteobacteria bacterium]
MPPLHAALTVAATALGLFAAVHALLNKRRPQAAFGWIAVSLALPFVGPLLYYLFGINRVESRARVLRGTIVSSAPLDPAAELPLVGGNRVDALRNGEDAYPAMLAAIRGAERSIRLSTYIFGTRGVGAEFVEALAAARRRGVDVRVLLDGVGELYTWPRAGAELRRRGVRVARFLPPRLIPPTLHVNLRNHRKILVVDGAVAFTGGMNIDARHLVGDPARERPVVDLHFRLAGPVVALLDAVFVTDWRFATGESLPPAAPGEPCGDALCRVVADGPDENRDPLVALLLEAVASARRRVAIMTPYFLPPPELVGVMQATALRGIDVAVVLPATNNLPYVHWATRHMLWELLLFGVRVYYQPGPFVHTKLLVVDDERAVVGSWNLDPRSLRLNFELAVEVRDARLVDALAAHFDECRARSTPVTLRDVDGRPLPERIRDGAAWLFTPYL